MVLVHLIQHIQILENEKASFAAPRADLVSKLLRRHLNLVQDAVILPLDLSPLAVYQWTLYLVQLLFPSSYVFYFCGCFRRYSLGVCQLRELSDLSRNGVNVYPDETHAQELQQASELIIWPQRVAIEAAGVTANNTKRLLLGGRKIHRRLVPSLVHMNAELFQPRPVVVSY